MKQILCALLCFSFANSFAVTPLAFAQDMNTLATIIWAGDHCYRNAQNQIPNLTDDLAYLADTPQDFMNGYNKIPNPADQQVAYMSNLLTFQILNDYAGDSAAQFNAKYCAANDSRKVFANDLLTETLVFKSDN